MPNRPTRLSPHVSMLASFVNDTLRIGQYYAQQFDRLAVLAATIQVLADSGADSSPLLEQLRELAEEAGANLQLELDLLNRARVALGRQPEVANEQEPQATRPGSRTLH